MIKTNSIKATYIGQELPELTPVEIVGRTMSKWTSALRGPERKRRNEVDEAGSPLALDNG